MTMTKRTKYDNNYFSFLPQKSYQDEPQVHLLLATIFWIMNIIVRIEKTTNIHDLGYVSLLL